MSHYVGIDPSLGGCGVVVLDTTGKVLTSATIKSKPAQDPVGRIKRYKTIANQVAAVCAPSKSSCVRIEGYSFASQGRAVTGLAELRAILLDTLMAYGVSDIEEVPPSSLKSFFTGSGKAAKEDMLAAAKEHGFECGKDHNQADAYALAAWAHQGMKTKPKAKKPRKVKVPKPCSFCSGTGQIVSEEWDFVVEKYRPSVEPCPKCKKEKKDGTAPVSVRKGKA